ncbi:MAG: hypothetical protein ACLFVP_03825 [Candidatus Bathyarchaeia archaeon]
MASEKLVNLPEYPKVEVRGDSITIIGEDGEEKVWGIEENQSIARRAASDVELNLRAVRYVKLRLGSSLNELMDELLDMGISREYLDRVLLEGYYGLREMMLELSKNKIFVDK